MPCYVHLQCTCPSITQQLKRSSLQAYTLRKFYRLHAVLVQFYYFKYNFKCLPMPKVTQLSCASINAIASEATDVSTVTHVNKVRDDTYLVRIVESIAQ
jgi:hypothetical protein